MAARRENRKAKADLLKSKTEHFDERSTRVFYAVHAGILVRLQSLGK